MFSRFAFILVTLFWLAMNVLLWRTEYGRRNSAGSPVPPTMVWQKMLNAPDSSSLNILHHGKKIGFCHWTTSVGEELSRLTEAETPPEGMAGRMSGYRIQVEGNVALDDFTSRLRFESDLKLNADKHWQEFDLRLNLRPTLLEIHSVAAEESIHIQAGEGPDRFERTIRFSELRNPNSLIAELGGPLAVGIWSNFGLSSGSRPGGPPNLGLNWEARNDSMRIGRTHVRAYRLQTRLLDRFQTSIFVSAVGEILRVEMPDEIVLVNDQLANFKAEQAMIEVIHLEKKFGNLVAVNDVNLTVQRGEFFALLGPNAAGKTTTLKILAGLMRPTSGCAKVAGFDVQSHPMEARKRIAFVPDFPFLYDKLTPWEFLRFTGQLFQMTDHQIETHGRELIGRFNLQAAINQPIEGLSHGTRQRVAIVSALLHQPEVFVIDEPMVGLDPQHARVVKNVLKERSSAGMTVFVSTHQLGVAEELADRIGIMHQGRLIAAGTGEQLRCQSGSARPLEEIFLTLTSDERTLEHQEIAAEKI